MTACYTIGIDLGTTNSVLGYARHDAGPLKIEILPIPQLVAAGSIESRTALPSFVHLPLKSQGGAGLDLPWKEGQPFAVGEMARRLGAELPEQTVGGAKSWLCHSRVDRHQPILPWGADESLRKISPIEATQRYLEHLVAAWEHQFPESPMHNQQVVLTVPASFDASARELTREAARLAGLPESLVLLEEPMSAVYAWIESCGDAWRRELKVGDILLVCDVGGGTTDLTLIEAAEEAGELTLRRVAVGRHLLVGGDNMDLALAHHVAGMFEKKGVTLDPWQSVSMWHHCRQAKEALLGEDPPKSFPISILGRGSKLIGGTVSVQLDRATVATQLLDGFVPMCQLTDSVERQKRSGFQDIGLQFETDVRITRHLASFVAEHGVLERARSSRVKVLLNGGVFRSQALRDRLNEVIRSWFPKEIPVGELSTNVDLDHAVARGAASYGWTKSHGGVRIRGGIPRAYYIGIETAGLAIPGAARPLRALCVAPLGMEEGTEFDVPSDPIGLTVGEPAHFRFFSSTTRKDDSVGTRVSNWTEEEIEESDSLEASLDASEVDTGEHYVPVTIRSHVTELGVLELWCLGKGNDRKWKLEFSVREN